MKLSLLALFGCISSVVCHESSFVKLPDYVPASNKNHGMENLNIAQAETTNILVDTEFGQMISQLPIVQNMMPMVEQREKRDKWNAYFQNIVKFTVRLRIDILVYYLGLFQLLFTG